MCCKCLRDQVTVTWGLIDPRGSPAHSKKGDDV